MEANDPPVFFLHNNFFGYLVEVGQIKELVDSQGKGCVYIKDWFKPIFPPLSNLTPS